MNVLEFDSHPLSTIILDPRMQKIYRAVGYFGEMLDFFSPLGFEANYNFDYKTYKLKPHPIRASEWYLNNKNPIYGQETVLIFRFCAESFESDLTYLCIYL